MLWLNRQNHFGRLGIRRLDGGRVEILALLRRSLVPFQFHDPRSTVPSLCSLQQLSDVSRAPHFVRGSRHSHDNDSLRCEIVTLRCLFTFLISRYWRQITLIRNYWVLCQLLVSMASVYGVWQCGWGMVCGFLQWSNSSAPLLFWCLCRILKASVKLDALFR